MFLNGGIEVAGSGDVIGVDALASIYDCNFLKFPELTGAAYSLTQRLLIHGSVVVS